MPLRVAVMGCVVNGPGEAREADLGVASGNGKGQIFVRGEVIKTVPESQIVETLIEEAMKLAEAADAGRPGRPARRTHGHRLLNSRHAAAGARRAAGPDEASPANAPPGVGQDGCHADEAARRAPGRVHRRGPCLRHRRRRLHVRRVSGPGGPASSPAQRRPRRARQPSCTGTPARSRRPRCGVPACRCRSTTAIRPGGRSPWPCRRCRPPPRPRSSRATCSSTRAARAPAACRWPRTSPRAWTPPWPPSTTSSASTRVASVPASPPCTVTPASSPGCGPTTSRRTPMPSRCCSRGRRATPPAASAGTAGCCRS